jgi:hypothetical protein
MSYTHYWRPYCDVEQQWKYCHIETLLHFKKEFFKSLHTCLFLSL